nr:pre-mRNA splicing Prp18-interacting factor [Tanacetum cinerariifolium]
MSLFNQRECVGCGQPSNALFCYLCTCKQCGNNLINGVFLRCTYGDEDSFAYDPNPYSFNDTSNVFTHPPQSQYETYLCELCGNDSHYGYECPPRFPLVYEQEPSHNQNYDDNYYPHNSLSFLCCDNYEGPHDSFQCQPMNQNYFELNPCYDSNYFDFDQPPQYTIDHQPDEGMSKSDMIFEKIKMMFQQLMERLNEENQAKIEEMNQSTIPLSDIISKLPPSIIITTSPPVLPIEDPDVSLIMGNEELNTIPKKESDEFIKSSVEDLVLIPSEFEDTSESDSECILPSCDDFSSINVFEEKAVTFPNPLFNSNDDFTSSDDESLSDEDVPEENVKIYSNPLFEFDDEYISSDVNPLFDEVLEDIECKDSYDSNLDESTFLVTSLFDSNEDEYFTPGDDVELLLHRDPSTPIISVVSILEGFTDELPLEENDDLFDLESKENEWKKILYDAPINDLMTDDKVFDPGIPEKICSLTYVVSPFLLSSGSEDTIFDPGISAFYFSHRSSTQTQGKTLFTHASCASRRLNPTTSDTHLATLAIPSVSIGGKDVYLIQRLKSDGLELVMIRGPRL